MSFIPPPERARVGRGLSVPGEVRPPAPTGPVCSPSPRFFTVFAEPVTFFSRLRGLLSIKVFLSAVRFLCVIIPSQSEKGNLKRRVFPSGPVEGKHVFQRVAVRRKK